MENNPKKSKALIITFVIILLLLIGGYLLFKNSSIFGTKGSSAINKVFSPLFGTSKDRPLDIVDDNVTINNELNITVRALAGEDLKRGDVLYVESYNENNLPIVFKAIANDKDKSIVFGLAANDAKKGEEFDIIKKGVLDGLNTNRSESSSWQVQDPLYLDSVIFGGMVKDFPLPPSFKVRVAYVLVVSSVNGSIEIDGSFGDLNSSDSYNNFNNGDNKNGNTNLNPIPNPSNSCTNNATNPPLCTTINGKCLNGAINPDICNDIIDNSKTECSDEGDNDGDKLIDNMDPNCHIDGDLSLEYIPNHDSELASPPSVYENICTLMDSFPLEFTSDQKADLDELLRKFYLIAPSLRSEIDINITYTEIEKYKNFVDHIDSLTNQCYSEGISRPTPANPDGVVNPSYKGPTTRYGNPWYKYNTNRGSYFDKNTFDCKYVSGWFSGRGADGTDCETYNKQMYTTQSPASCTTPLRFTRNTIFNSSYNTPQRSVYIKALANKCVWNPGVRISEIEKIVNVW